MNHRSRGAIAVLLLLTTLLIPSAALANNPPGLPVQLELGDSWTYGDGASDPATTGYAGLIFAANVDELDCLPSGQAGRGCKHLQRVTLARPGTAQNPGVTTDAFIDEQLDTAVALLADRNGDDNPRNDVELVVLSVGGNDVSGPVLAACLGGLDASCVGVIQERLAHVATNLEQILGGLRQAAGPDADIIVATYDNAITHCPLGGLPGASQLGALVLEGFPELGIVGLNNVIRQAAGENGVEVADTYGQLGAGDWVGDCLHPNDAGYARIASIFSQQIG